MAVTGAARFCQQQAAPDGSDLHYASLFLAPQLRRPLYAAHAGAIELERALHSPDPGIARLRLQWWKQQLNPFAPEPSHHPILLEINSLHEAQPPAAAALRERFSAWTRAWEQQCGQAPAAADAPALVEQQRYCSGALWRWTAEVCGFEAEQTGDCAERLGCLLGCLQQLRHYPLKSVPDDCPEAERLPRLQAQLRYVRAGLQQIEPDFPQADRSRQSVCLIMARLASETCKEIEQEGCQLLRQGTALTPLRKLWLAGRTRWQSRDRTGRG